MSRIRLFVPLFIFVILASFLWWGLGGDPDYLPSPLIGKPVPEFSLPDLLSDTDEQVTDEQLKGQPYLINVWATWCPTCRYEHPYLVELAKQGVNIVGINYKDEDGPAREWLRRLGDPYSVNVVDKEGRLGLDLGVSGAPETFAVDAQGIIRANHRGEVNPEIWRSLFAPHMN